MSSRQQDVPPSPSAHLSKPPTQAPAVIGATHNDTKAQIRRRVHCLFRSPLSFLFFPLICSPVPHFVHVIIGTVLPSTLDLSSHPTVPEYLTAVLLERLGRKSSGSESRAAEIG